MTNGSAVTQYAATSVVIYPTGSANLDFDDDGVLGLADIDMLTEQIAAGTNDPLFDLNGDTLVELADRDVWLATAGAVNLPSGNPYRLGDANLDGVVDGQDFISWNTYKFTTGAAWSKGDFNADGVVDGQDFIIWNTNKFTSAMLLGPPSGFATTDASMSQVRQPLASEPLADQTSFLPVATRHDLALMLIYGQRQSTARELKIVDTRVSPAMAAAMDQAWEEF
jgi:hypothetical protein